MQKKDQAENSKYQLTLSEPETRRLAARVDQDYRNAISDHERRIALYAEFLRRWRRRTDLPYVGSDRKSNYPVPVINWMVNQKWAMSSDSIFGDDAEIVAVPTGPSDYRNEKKISLYMTWRVFQSMDLTNRLLQFEFYKILFGRSVAYAPWVTRSFDFQTSKGNATKTYYKGPDFRVLEPDDFICPAEDVETLHDFSWIGRKYNATPQELLMGEDEGRYQGIKKNFKKILSMANRNRQRDSLGDEVKRERDDAEGVQHEAPISGTNVLKVLEWYGKWRMLKKGQLDADEIDILKRSLYESEIVIKYIPDLNLIIGVQDLAQLYPVSKHRRPFVEASYQKDGSYWCDGMAAQLLDVEDELRVNHNMGTDAMEFAVSPPIGFRPASGYDPDKYRFGPGATVPLDNPATDWRVLSVEVNLESIAAREQGLLSYIERQTGISDLTAGRQPDRPNAPKTARGTIALLEQGNLRMTIDTVTLREDYANIFEHFWSLEYQFGDEETFFRVTEDDADGLFATAKGGAMLTQADRNGDYDFRLKLATSKIGRQAEQENTLARYQIDLQNPLIVQNPVALWKVTNDVHKALGDPNFGDLVPEPPQPDAPINPKEEWTRIQQGENIQVNPMDNDQLHMIRHAKDMQMAIDDKYGDTDAIKALKAHYVEHVHQLQEKKLVQAIAEKAVQTANQLGTNPAAGLGLPPGILSPPGAAPMEPGPMPIEGSAPPPVNPKPFSLKGKKPQ